jgi:glycosyltransferase involved in cell wall biosynthesis
MPVYNRIPWAVEALRSVLDQTYTDFEVVVVDDGSTEDPTPLMMTDRRVRYFRQENRGASAARNLGVSLARGRYVAFLDSDDLFAPDKLEKQVLAMEGSPHVAISHTSYILIDAEGETIDEVYSGRYSGKVYPGIYTDSHHIATPTVMVRSEALDRTLGFNEAVRCFEKRAPSGNTMASHCNPCFPSETSARDPNFLLIHNARQGPTSCKQISESLLRSSSSSKGSRPFCSR